MPTQLPVGWKDIEDFLAKADTVIYIAEFFRECIAAIRSHLGPSKLTVDTIDQQIKTKSPNFYQSLLDNTINAGDCFMMLPEPAAPTLQTLQSYYGSTSLANLGRIVCRYLAPSGLLGGEFSDCNRCHTLHKNLHECE
jgi:hypothetical protein